MMVASVLSNPQYIVRNALPMDRMKLAAFLQASPLVHRHLDWRSPLDWLGSNPFLVLEASGKIAATLSCPEHPPKVSWVRLFSAAHFVNPREAWNTLWTFAKEFLEGNGNPSSTGSVSVLPLEPWFKGVLEESGFKQVTEVVVLMVNDLFVPDLFPEGITIRPMRLRDMVFVGSLDREAFEPLWHQPSEDLELAFRQSSISTVAERNGAIIGYQITTPTQFGGHLARLAVHPSQQGEGIGSGLVRELMKQLRVRGARGLSVNTQSDNQASLSLYHKLGFLETGDRYPVFQQSFRGNRGK